MLEIGGKPVCPFGQNLKRMVRAMLNDIENLIDVVVPYCFVKQVGHRIDKINCGLLPSHGLVKAIRENCELKSILIARSPHGLKAISYGFRIAVLAAG